MGERIYLKTKKENSKFIKFLKEAGADYYEKDSDKEFGVFIMPKMYGGNRLGIKLKENKKIVFGKIDEDCNNFNYSINKMNYFPEEQEWMIGILQKTLKWRGGK